MNIKLNAYLLIAAMTCGLCLASVASAQSFTDFEPTGFVPGESVQNHAPDGTDALPPIAFTNNMKQAWFVPTATTDEEVVDLSGSANPADAAHGNVWRFSQGANSGGNQGAAPHSANSGLISGELGGALMDAGGGQPTTNKFYAQFDFKSATGATQAGMVIDVSANTADTRQAFTRIVDDGTGFDLTFFDTSGNDFNGTTLDLNLSYTEWHTIGIEIDFVDGLAVGTDPDHATGTGGGAGSVGNDIVNIYHDGNLVISGTSWETVVGSRSVDRLLFASQSGNVISGQLGGGLYFDNVLVTDTNTIPEPASLVLLGLGGVCGLSLMRRRKRTA